MHALVIAAPIGAGLYALYSQPASAGRFGRLLVLSGFLWSPTLLAESADSLLYSVGRISAWSAEVAARIRGPRLPVRPPEPAARTSCLFRAAAVTVGVLYLPTSLLVEQYPVPDPVEQLRIRLPAQRIPGDRVGAGIHRLPSSSRSPRPPPRLVFAAVALVLALRLVRGSRLTRVGLLPVLAVAIVRMAAAAAFMVARRASPDSQLTEVLGTVALLCIPAFPSPSCLGSCARGWPRGALW